MTGPLFPCGVLYAHALNSQAVGGAHRIRNRFEQTPCVFARLSRGHHYGEKQESRAHRNDYMWFRSGCFSKANLIHAQLEKQS